MYTCENCNKEYSSQKGYFSHIELCEEQKDRRSLSRSIELSDIEDDRSRSRSRSQISVSGTKVSLRDTVDRLMKDRAKYKSELKKYKADSISNDHRNELERNQEYFQEQIFSLTEERDELIEKLNLSREEIFTEKERLRSEFAKKIASEKKRLESRYGGNNSTVTSRLQSTIDKLQDRLNVQLEEKDRIREEYETQINLLTEQHRTITEQSQEDIRKAKQVLNHERDELHRAAQLFQVEKETSIAVIRREKDQEIQALIAEKDTVIQSLEFTLKNLQKDKELMEKDHNRIITDINCQHELNIKEKNNIINKLKDTHSRTLDQVRIKHESNINFLNDKANKDLEVIADQHRKEKVMIEAKHVDKIKEIHSEFGNRIQELENELSKYKQQIFEVERDSKILIDKANKDSENYIIQMKKEKEQDVNNLKREMNKNHQEDVKDRDDTINELERLNHALGAQVGHYRSAMENMKNDTARIKQQFILNLNKQKEEDDKAIVERENRIITLETDIKALHDRFSQQLNIAKQNMEKIQYDKLDIMEKIKICEEANNDMQKRLEQSELQRVNVIDNYEKRIDVLKKDYISKLNNAVNTENDKYKKEIKQLQDKLVISESQHVTITDNYEKRIDEIKKEYSTKLSNAVNTENDKYQKEIKQVQEKLAVSEDRLKHINDQHIKEMNNQRRELLQYNEKQLETIRIDLDKTKNENFKLIASFEKDKKQFLSTINTESIKAKTREDDLIKKVDQLQRDLQHSQSVIEDNRKHFVVQLSAITGLTSTEKQELKHLKEELVLKDDQLEKLKSFSTNLNKKLLGLQNAIDISRNELASEKEKMAKEKEELEKKAATPIKDPEMDNRFRKLREDCIESIRKNKIEINSLKQENSKLKEEITMLENKLKETDKNIKEKDNFISEKSVRIKELESMLSEAIRKLTN